MTASNDRLKLERRRRGWTQNQLADRMFQVAGKRGLLIPTGLSGFYVSRWERGVVQPDYHSVHLLCLAFDLPADRLGLPGGTAPYDEPTVPIRKGIITRHAADPASSLTAWIAETNTDDQAVEQLEEATSSLARAHTGVPARRMLADILRIHTQAQTILRGGKQRLRQTRALLHVEADLLAQACMLLGDLGNNERAAQYGTAALLYAQEAGSNEAIAWSARAKTARWQDRFVESADLARRGFEVTGGSVPTRVELAYREANAAALLGDMTRAREAIRRGERLVESVTIDDSDRSVWSFPTPRQAVFAMSVAIHTGDPDAALRAAAMADAAWAAGVPRIEATWAQIRAGAGIAHLMKGALDATIEQTDPVLSLPPELRIDTVMAYLRELDRRLTVLRFANDRQAIGLRERVREFYLAAHIDDGAIDDA
jgi:transcriptional regulator with XRE-family HTH domain